MPHNQLLHPCAIMTVEYSDLVGCYWVKKISLPEIKKSHEMEKKSLEDLLYEKQESLEVGKSQSPPPLLPTPPSSFSRLVWFWYVSVHICNVSGARLFTYVPHFTVCVLETNQWFEEWKWHFKWKVEIRRTKKSIKRESKFSKLCMLPHH